MGGHLALLQTVAWSNMLVNFSSSSSISEAVGKTFDGEHPCELCKVVEQSKQEDKEQQSLKAEMKIEMILPVPVIVPSPHFSEVAFSTTAYCETFGVVYLDLPVQPPRSA